MVDIKTILSDVQMDLGDNANEAIQRAEYVDTINNIIRTVSSETRIYLNRKIYTPNDGTSTDPIYQCTVAASDSPHFLLTVYRKKITETLFTECREYGYQTNMATLRGERSFQKNDVQLGTREFHTQFMNESTGLVDDGRHIIFNEPIEPLEEIAVDFVSNAPITVVTWSENMTLQVPNFLEDAVRYGVQYRLMERLFNRGNNDYSSRAQVAERNYDKALKKARAYANNYLHKGSGMQLRPIKWLPENYRRTI